MAANQEQQKAQQSTEGSTIIINNPRKRLTLSSSDSSTPGSRISRFPPEPNEQEDANAQTGPSTMASSNILAKLA